MWGKGSWWKVSSVHVESLAFDPLGKRVLDGGRMIGSLGLADANYYM